MQKAIRLSALALVVATTLIPLAMLASPVHAQDTPVPVPSPVPAPKVVAPAQDVPVPPGEFDKKDATKATGNAAPELIIAGQVVIRLRTSAGGMTAQERGYDLSQRIGPILTLPNLSASDVRIQQMHPGETSSIYVRDRLLITVDRSLATANNATVEELAQQWADNLRATLPKINVAVRMTTGISKTASSSLPTPKATPKPTKHTRHKKHYRMRRTRR